MTNKEKPFIWKDVWLAEGPSKTYKILFNVVFFKEEYGPYMDCLNREELEYFGKLVSNRRKLSYLFGRYSLKKNVADYMGKTELQEIGIRNGIFSQPVIYLHGQSVMQGTLSHCEDCAVSLVYDESLVMGIDIENKSRNLKKIIYHELTEDEKQLLESMDRTEDDLYGGIWTIKEALSKCLRTGLTIPLALMEIDRIMDYGYYLESTFKYFTQYKAITFFLDGLICTITYPKNVQIDFGIEKIVEGLWRSQEGIY